MVVQKRLLFLLFLLTACIPAQGDRAIPAELDCQRLPTRPESNSAANVITITVAANAYRDFCWKLYGVVAAATAFSPDEVVVVPTLHNMVGPAFQERLVDAFAAGNAPDIIALSNTTVQPFAEAGYLTPLDDCVRQHRAFDAIYPAVWPQVTWEQHIWGIPFEIGTFLLYFNKQKLAELGWSAAEIADLPQKIAKGQFTLADLLNVAHQAIQLGVVDPGFGFWPHLDDPWTLQLSYVAYGGRLFDQATQKLVITQAALTNAYTFHQTAFQRNITHANLADPNHAFNDLVLWEDAVAHGRVLFWVGGNYNWPMLAFEYGDDLTPAIDPSAMFGYALFPAAQPGQPGQALWVQTGFYALTTAQVGKHAPQQAACTLLANTLTPAIAVRHSARSGFMSTLDPAELAPYWPHYPFLQAQAQMWPHLIPLPRHVPAYTELYVPILNNYLAQVQTGALSAASASELAILELRRQLQDGLLVE